VSSLTVDSTGNGNYTSAPTVLIAPPLDASYTTYWSNDGTSVAGSEPSSAIDVAVDNGLFTVVLGENMTGMTASLFTQPNLKLRIWFNDGAHGFAALEPAQNLTPAPYASFANTASNLVNGLRVQPDNTYGAPNVIGGSSANYVSNNVIGATIRGAGRRQIMEAPFTQTASRLILGRSVAGMETAPALFRRWAAATKTLPAATARP
jgi:hypothetical protein